ncbi:MAG: D-tyrosyl-tRNA(Tyr) deacylase [Lachnospiraceae bacterium]|nr:D-tyrosyl-tRNA(Tyr) deacylase [Lachnospiraceae bacterium]
MRFVIQVVSKAEVKIEGRVKGSIDRGFLVLMGACGGDTVEIADKMIKKLLGLRIFPDENGKTNLSLSDVNGELLIVSQFTLYADCKKGNRPSFVKAGSPAEAESLYEYVISKCRETVGRVETGEFGAEMQVSLVNEGPFTIILDSDELNGKQ